MAFSRHAAREYALQALYQMEILCSREALPREEFLNHIEFFLDSLETPAEAKVFIRRLVMGTLEAQQEIDRLLTEHLENWRLDRLSVLVRNILRLATYEIGFQKETPFQVVMDEALELTKDFVDDPSRSFVNSVMQKIQNHFTPTPLPSI